MLDRSWVPGFDIHDVFGWTPKYLELWSLGTKGDVCLQVNVIGNVLQVCFGKGHELHSSKVEVSHIDQMGLTNCVLVELYAF